MDNLIFNNPEGASPADMSVGDILNISENSEGGTPPTENSENTENTENGEASGFDKDEYLKKIKHMAGLEGKITAENLDLKKQLEEFKSKYDDHDARVKSYESIEEKLQRDPVKTLLEMGVSREKITDLLMADLGGNEGGQEQKPQYEIPDEIKQQLRDLTDWKKDREAKELKDKEDQEQVSAKQQEEIATQFWGEVNKLTDEKFPAVKKFGNAEAINQTFISLSDQLKRYATPEEILTHLEKNYMEQVNQFSRPGQTSLSSSMVEGGRPAGNTPDYGRHSDEDELRKLAAGLGD